MPSLAGLSLTCLSLLPSLTPPQTPSQAAVPPAMDSLMKGRVVQQFQAHNPQAELRFDDKTCAQQGNYRYTDTELIVDTSQTPWPGTKSFLMSDLIEGRRIDFPALAGPPPELEAKPESRGGLTWKSAAWIGGGLGVAVGALLWVRHRNVRTQTAPTLAPAAAPAAPAGGTVKRF